MRMEGSMSVFKILTSKTIGKILSGRPRGRCDINIRIYFKVIGANTGSWVVSAQGRDYYSGFRKPCG